MLYFLTVYWMVHLEAGRRGLDGLPREECPSALRAIREGWYLVLPLLALVYLLFAGYTPLFAGTVGLALTAVLILGTGVAREIGPTAIRVLLWLALGLAAATFLRFGIEAVLVLIVVLVVANAFRSGGRATLALCRDSLAEGARSALPVGIACALVGVIIGTHHAHRRRQQLRPVHRLGRCQQPVLVAAPYHARPASILGMGIPTIPNYIITASIAGPALLDLGVPLIVSHMFVFYFGIMADLTPPVALAAFAASPIARAPGLQIGLQCMRIAIAGFVVPFMAVYTPALMLQDGGALAQAAGYPVAVAYIVRQGGGLDHAVGCAPRSASGCDHCSGTSGCWRRLPPSCWWRHCP